jgi:GWxTD domain-containing protein
MGASLLLLAALAGAIDCAVDWAAFRARGDSGRVDFFYAIPHHQLLYVDSAGELSAVFTVDVSLRGLDNGFVQNGSFRKRARLPAAGFVDAAERRRTFVDGFSITAPAGRYRFDLGVVDSAPSGLARGGVTDSLVIPGWTERPALSSLQLGARCVRDATGALSVLPNPSRRFGVAGLDTVYFYFEGYGLSNDTNQYGLETTVRRRGEPARDTVVQSGFQLHPKAGTDVAAAFGLGVAALDPGGYTLAVALTDLVNRKTVVGERDFLVGAELAPAAQSPQLESLSERERRYYHEIQCLTTPAEFARYQALSDAGKEAYLAWFWPRHNLTEFARRMETADNRFRRPKQSGIATDRGRIYVKYGEPDGVEQRVIETDVRPREYWHYYGAGYTFVFVDVRGDGNYRLAWTNSKDEPPTGLEQYLTDEEQQEYK